MIKVHGNVFICLYVRAMSAAGCINRFLYAGTKVGIGMYFMKHKPRTLFIY